MSQQCKWCYSPATMKAWSIRHSWHMLCDRHYEEARSAMKAWMIEKQYEQCEPTCDICGVDCEDASHIRAYNVRILHNDGSHERCDLTSDCRKGN